MRVRPAPAAAALAAPPLTPLPLLLQEAFNFEEALKKFNKEEALKVCGGCMGVGGVHGCGGGAMGGTGGRV